MSNVYFFSPSGYLPMKDSALKSMCSGSHGWQATGASWVFGVATVKEGVHPEDVADHLSSLGVIPLPAFADSTSEIPQTVYEQLKDYISSGDRTLAIAQKMHAASGHPLLRPSLR